MKRRKNLIGPVSLLVAVSVAVLVAVVVLSDIERHGRPYLLYLLGAIGFPACGAYFVWAALYAVREGKRAYAPWFLLAAPGALLISVTYWISFVMAWRGDKLPLLAYLPFLIGLCLLLVMVVGSIVTARREDQRQR